MGEHIFRKNYEYNKKNVLYDLESHAKDGRCGLSRNEDIRRFEGKLIEKQAQRRAAADRSRHTGYRGI